MNRRGFLKLFASAAPVAVVAPTYFFAPIGGWKSDVIVNPDYYGIQWPYTIGGDVDGGMAYYEVGGPPKLIYPTVRETILPTGVVKRIKGVLEFPASTVGQDIIIEYKFSRRSRRGR
jgi:hypothetical protein